jgi:hypothetical protein
MHGHVREMESEAHLQRFDVRSIRARKRYPYLDSAVQSIDRAWKLRQRRIASPVEYPAVERGDFLRYQGLTARESCDRLLFRLLHHRGVADDVANHDRRDSTLHGKASQSRRNARFLPFHFVAFRRRRQVPDRGSESDVGLPRGGMAIS